MILKKASTVFNKFNFFNLSKNVRYINISSIKNKIVKFKLFDIGEGISQVEILNWCKKEGEQIEEMEHLLTVQSDKAAVDITSKYTGTIVKIYRNEKDIVKIGNYLCEIDTEDAIDEHEESEKERLEQEDSEQENLNVQKLENEDTNEHDSILFKDTNEKDDTSFIKNVKCSPSVKKKAKEYNLNINEIGNFYNKDHITINDLENYRIHINQKDNIKKDSRESNEQLKENKVEIKLTGLKLAMAKSMNDSLSIPIFHLNDYFIINDLLKMKNEFNNSIENNMKITLTSIIIKLISIALHDFPILNSKFDQKNNSYTIYKNHNICIAMDTPNGLLVPNIKNVQTKNILEIQKDLIDLHNKATENKLSMDDITNGTISVSNYGTISGSFALPILYDHQAIIIGVSKIEKTISLKNDQLNSLNDIFIANKINLTFGADHRYIDGATIARFSKKMKSLIEHPFNIFKYLK